MIKSFAKLLKVLNSETDPAQISLAVCFAMVLGFTPFYSLHNMLVILLVLVLRVNLSTFFLSVVFFSGMAYLFDPLFHLLGQNLLTAQGLHGFWSQLYSHFFWRVTRFNNTLVLGSLTISILLFFPVFILSNRLILKYRETVLAWARKTRLMQALRATRLFQTYETLSSMEGDG